MLDFNSVQNRIELIDREDRALLRSNPSARSMPEDGQEHAHPHMLLPSRSSFGRKAINLLSWCEAPTKVKQVNDRPPVGHMSVFNQLCEKESVTSEDERGQQLRNLPARHRSIGCFSSSLRSL